MGSYQSTTLRALTRAVEVSDKRAMIDPSLLEPLRARQAQITKRRSDLGSRMEKLRREDISLETESEEIATTLKTLSRIYGVELDDLPEIKAGKITGGTSTKPDGAPTLFEMVSIILSDNSLVDYGPMEGDQIFEEIKRRWWPDAPRNSIIPSLWRFAKEDRLIKEGTAYGLIPKDETPGAGTPDASNFEEDLDDEIPF